MDAASLLSHASGDLLADRRYAYAHAAAAAGDHAAAAEILDQALERAPAWAAAWLALGEARLALGEVEAASAALRRAVDLDARDRLGAGLRLAHLAGSRPAGAPESYVQTLFDRYAPRFETHLTQSLHYRGPALLAERVQRIAPGTMFRHVVDLGCGTGLCGRSFRSLATVLVGIDLSPAMIEEARRKTLYDALIVAPIDVALQEMEVGSVSLLLAADVLVYIGDLAPLFSAAGRALAPGGLFAFTLQKATEAYTLGADLRFAHAPEYIHRVAQDAGLAIALLEPAKVRDDEGAEGIGLVVVARRA